MDFHGVKVALLIDDKLLLHLRDNTPGLFNANMWDFPGGGREGTESPIECAIREIDEELSILLTPESFMWERKYPAQKDPNQSAYFMVATLSANALPQIHLTEGQKWQLFTEEDFFADPQVIGALKERFKDYTQEGKKLPNID